jgi:hypothetical protein
MRVVLTALKYVLGLGLLGWVLWAYWQPSGGGPGLADVLHQDLHLIPLLLAAAACAAGVLLTFVRWLVLVRAQDLPFGVGDAVRLGCASYYLSIILPGSVSGDVLKAAFLAREQERRTAAVATVLIDRVVGLCGLFWLVALVGAVFWAGDLGESADTAALRAIIGAASGLAAASVLFWLVLGILPAGRAQGFADRLARLPKVGRLLAELWRAVWLYRCRGRSVGLALLLALLANLGFVLTF